MQNPNQFLFRFAFSSREWRGDEGLIFKPDSQLNIISMIRKLWKIAVMCFKLSQCCYQELSLPRNIFPITCHLPCLTDSICNGSIHLTKHVSLLQMSPVKRICVFEHSVMTNFNCACPAIQRGQGSGFLSEGSSWFTACMSEQRRFWRDCADD